MRCFLVFVLVRMRDPARDLSIGMSVLVVPLGVTVEVLVDQFSMVMLV